MPLDSEQIDLIRALFATANEILEDAHRAAVQGQAPDLALEDYHAHAATLGEAADRLKRLARGLEVLIARAGE
jgi:hypothetical protein